MRINCLIIDDEPLSQEVIADFVKDCPELKLAGICNNALEAANILQSQNIDLIFLDINMPRLSGLGFVKSLKIKPLIVFVTAYPEYALDGFEVDAVDYLLKPVSFERFRIAINKVVERCQTQNRKEQLGGHIMVRADKKSYKVNFNEILYLEAQGDYIRFFTATDKLMVHGKLKDFLEKLPSEFFVQIHKSYVISIAKVVYLEGSLVRIGQYSLPVSLNFKNQLIKKLDEV